MDEAPSTNATASAKLREPFKVRPELLAPEWLAPNVQRLLATRSRAIEELADQSLVVVLATAKYFTSAGRTELPRVGVIGGGAVGCAVLMKLLVYAYPSDLLALSTRQPERLPKCEALQSPAALALFEQVARYDDNTRLARESDVVVLCVPPSQFKGVALQIKFAAGEKNQDGTNAPLLIASALCGVSHESLAKSCGSRAVVRVLAMPLSSPLSAPMEEDGGKKNSRRVLEALLTALSELDAVVLPTRSLYIDDATTSVERGEGDGESAKRARVRALVLSALSSPTDEQEGGGVLIQWPADWQRQLEQRLLLDVKHA